MEPLLLQCILCGHKTPRDFLRSHVRFHHMIQTETMVERIFEMHVAKESISVGTQTTVTWIKTLEEIEDSINLIAEHVEVKVNQSKPEEPAHKIDEQDSETRTNYESKSVEEAPEPSCLPSLEDISNEKETKDHILVSKSFDVEADANFVISSKDLNFPATPKESPEKDTSLSLELSDSESSSPKPEEEEGESRSTHNNEVTVINILNIPDEDTSLLLEPSDSENDTSKTEKDGSEIISAVNHEEIKSHPQNISQINSGVHMENIVKSLTRYQCPFCEFYNSTKSFADDHIIEEHSNETESKQPKGQSIARKQRMSLLFPRDPSIIRPSSNSTDEDGENDSNHSEWISCDATMPFNWAYRDVQNEHGIFTKVYCSPCDSEFDTKDQVAEFLLDQGKTFVKLSGFKVPDTEKIRCDGLCEGNCRLFNVPKSFYRYNDKNKKRRKTKLKFIADVEKQNTAEDKLIKSAKTLKMHGGIKYQKPLIKAERPWILHVEGDSETTSPVIKRGRRSLAVFGESDQVSHKASATIRDVDVTNSEIETKRVDHEQKKKNEMPNETGEKAELDKIEGKIKTLEPIVRKEENVIDDTNKLNKQNNDDKETVTNITDKQFNKHERKKTEVSKDNKINKRDEKVKSPVRDQPSRGKSLRKRCVLEKSRSTEEREIQKTKVTKLEESSSKETSKLLTKKETKRRRSQTNVQKEVEKEESCSKEEREYSESEGGSSRQNTPSNKDEKGDEKKQSSVQKFTEKLKEDTEVGQIPVLIKDGVKEDQSGSLKSKFDKQNVLSESTESREEGNARNLKADIMEPKFEEENVPSVEDTKIKRAKENASDLNRTKEKLVDYVGTTSSNLKSAKKETTKVEEIKRDEKHEKVETDERITADRNDSASVKQEIESTPGGQVIEEIEHSDSSKEIPLAEEETAANEPIILSTEKDTKQEKNLNNSSTEICLPGDDFAKMQVEFRKKESEAIATKKAEKEKRDFSRNERKTRKHSIDKVSKDGEESINKEKVDAEEFARKQAAFKEEEAKAIRSKKAEIEKRKSLSSLLTDLKKKKNIVEDNKSEKSDDTKLEKEIEDKVIALNVEVKEVEENKSISTKKERVKETTKHEPVRRSSQRSVSPRKDGSNKKLLNGKHSPRDEKEEQTKLNHLVRNVKEETDISCDTPSKTSNTSSKRRRDIQCDSPNATSTTKRRKSSSENIKSKVDSQNLETKQPKSETVEVTRSSSVCSSESDRENNKLKNIEKLKELQRNEVELIKNEGTYVQCCNENCQVWRLVKEFQDPSMVPDIWNCDMNEDKSNNTCGVGGQSSMNESETVEVKFTCGSMVWAKVKGFPWWPGMVDYCPDSQEFYWIEEEVSLTEPKWYNVVFFEGKGTQVTRGWVTTENIVKMTSATDPPKSGGKSKVAKSKFDKAAKMAEEARTLNREERLEKFSFAALYKGKWGEHLDFSEGDSPSPTKMKHDKKSSKIIKDSVEGGKLPQNSSKETSKPQTKKETPKTSLQKNKQKEVEKKESSTKEDLGSSENEGEGSRRTSGRFNDSRPLKKRISGMSKERLFLKEREKNMLMELVMKAQGAKKPVKSLVTKPSEQPKSKESSETKPNIPDNKADHSYSMEQTSTSRLQQDDSNPSESEEHPRIVDDAEETEVLPTLNPHVGKDHPRPVLPSDVLIALAVRNLDPNNYYGVSFNNIISFLTLHFPYYHRHTEECREMVRGAYDISAKEETGKENYRIKASLVEQLSLRIRSFVERSDVMVRESMLYPAFLDILVDRFSNGSQPHPAAVFRPPADSRLLCYFALASLCPPASLQHIEIFLKFLFPSLQAAFKGDNLAEGLSSDPLVEEFFEEGLKGRHFVIKEGKYADVLKIVRDFFAVKSNHSKLKRSIYKPDFLHFLLPNMKVK